MSKQQLTLPVTLNEALELVIGGEQYERDVYIKALTEGNKVLAKCSVGSIPKTLAQLGYIYNYMIPAIVDHMAMVREDINWNAALAELFLKSDLMGLQPVEFEFKGKIAYTFEECKFSDMTAAQLAENIDKAIMRAASDIFLIFDDPNKDWKQNGKTKNRNRD
jgi:hypothetical protein